MEKDLVQQALEEWTQGLDPLQSRIRLFEKVRDFPFRYPSSRDPVEVLQTGAGSCSGKHYLLAELYRRLGLPVRHAMCLHRFNDSPIPFPDRLQAMLDKEQILDVHNYLQIGVDGEWVDVDATWSMPLREYGFPVTDEWDGRSSMPLTVVREEDLPVSGDPARAKEEALSHFNPRQRKLRAQFLTALAEWVREIEAEESDEA